MNRAAAAAAALIARRCRRTAVLSRACAPLVEALEARRLLANTAPALTSADLPPLTVVQEGSTYTLSGKFTDPDAGDAHRVTIDWGDGSAVQTVDLAASARTFSVPHRYLDDATPGTEYDEYTIAVTVDDGTESAAASTTVGMFNVFTTPFGIFPISATVEGSPVTLQSGLFEPSPVELITFAWRVTDAAGAEVFAAGGTRTGPDPAPRITFMPSDNGRYTVTFTAYDDDGGLYSGSTVTTTVDVANAAPALSVTGAATAAPGEPYTLALAVSDPGADTVTAWKIDWGDGTVETLAGDASSATHVYATEGSRTIRASATDEDGTFAAAPRALNVTNGVNDAPVINDGDLVLSAAAVNEGGTLHLTGSFADSDPADAHTVRINWGDGAARTALNLAAGVTTFSTEHLYRDDNPTGTSIDPHSIVVTVTDTELSDTASASVLVRNVEPSLVLNHPASVNEGTSVSFTPAVTDPSRSIVGGGPADTFTYSWRVTRLGQIIATGATPTVAFTAADNGVYTVTFTVRDDDSGETARVGSIQAFNVAPTLSATGAATIAEGSAYTLNVAATDPGADTISSWTINWGDGTTETSIAGGGARTFIHVYTDGPATRPITVTATDEDGTYTTGTTGAQLDPTFGGDGLLTAKLAGYNSVRGEDVVVQGDGKILVVATVALSSTDSGDDLALFRFLPDGTPDASFGTNGVVVTDFGSLSEYARAVAVAPDGRIVVAGATTTPNGLFPLVARYSPGGALDSTFDGDGKLVLGALGRASNAQAVLVQADGRIVIGGTAFLSPTSNSRGFALARLTTSGVLDTTFGTGGLVRHDISPDVDEINDLAFTPDGRIVAAGTAFGFLSTTAANHNFAVGRYLANGAIDTSFGGGTGRVITDFGSNDDQGKGVVVQPDGRIVVAGHRATNTNFTRFDFAVARYTTSGALDTSFGGGGTGLVSVPVGPDGHARATDVELLPGGKIVVAGYALVNTPPSSTDFALVGLNPNGSLDTTFGLGGNLNTHIGGSDTAGSVAVTPAGAIVLAGTSGGVTTDDDDLAIARYTPGALSVAVTNVAPMIHEIRLTAPVEGRAINFSALVTDPSVVDSNSLAYEWTIRRGTDVVATSSDRTFSYTPDDNGPYSATLRVRDKDGGTSTLTRNFPVFNEGPTPTIAGAPVSATEGDTIALTGSATDPSPVDTAAGLSLSWTVTRDGLDFASGSGTEFALTPTDNGTYVVTLRATDKDGASRVTRATINVANAAPTASIGGAPAAATEGDTITLAGSADDPGLDDVAGGLSLAWTVTRDGESFASGSGGDFVFVPTNEGTYAVTLTATDKDGASATAHATIAVANAAPVITALAGPPHGGVRGQRLEFTAAFTDGGTLDAHTVTWDFGDGTVVALPSSDPAALRQSHVFTTAGAKTVTVTVSDGTDAGTRTLAFAVDVANVQPDPGDASKTATFVGGTTGADTIRFGVNRRDGTLEMYFARVLHAAFPASVGRVIVFGQAGDDVIDTGGAGDARAAIVFGDAGNDTLTGGSLGDALLGGAGADSLFGDAGRDLLVGGDDADRLFGDDDDDILIGGATRYDADAAQDTAALSAVFARWAQTSLSYADRIFALSSPGGLLEALAVFDDGDADLLVGRKGTDWFFDNFDGPGARDWAVDRDADETAANAT